MQDLTDLVAESRGLRFASDLVREARDFGLGVPILYWIGWLFVAYLLLYIVSVYIGPAFFGTGPYYYGHRPFWGRNTQTQTYPGPTMYMRQTRGAVAGMDEASATQLTARVMSSI